MAQVITELVRDTRGFSACSFNVLNGNRTRVLNGTCLCLEHRKTTMPVLRGGLTEATVAVAGDGSQMRGSSSSRRWRRVRPTTAVDGAAASAVGGDTGSGLQRRRKRSPESAVGGAAADGGNGGCGRRLRRRRLTEAAVNGPAAGILAGGASGSGHRRRQSVRPDSRDRKSVVNQDVYNTS